MKILVLSLLRLGDIILHREIAKSLKEQHPGCQVHFLIYSQFESVQKLLPEVDFWHFLPRNEIQKILVEREQTPIKAFEKLETVLAVLNSSQFDLVLNVTHNRFSVRLMDLLSAKEKRGVAFEMGRKVADQNRWQSYLNEHFSEVRGSQFHYLEVLKKSLGLSFEPPSKSEARTPQLILLQLLTSDSKKNWGLQRFHELKKKLEKQFPEDRILGLCSPQEKEQVSKVFDWNEFITPTLEEASQLLKEARLLVTGDTSIQHLASQQGCAVLSLFLGSADPKKTAPWQMGAWVIQGQAECAPCSHSKACHQKEHLCANSISVQSVFDLVDGILSQKEVRISQAQAHAQVYQMKKKGNSFSIVSQNESLGARLEHSVWSAYLDKKSQANLEDGQFDAAEIAELIQRHSRFQKDVEQIRAGNISVEEIEQRFPLWRDSLLRLKRDLACPMSWKELQDLISIRNLTLKQISQNTGASHGRNSRQSTEIHFAEA